MIPAGDYRSPEHREHFVYRAFDEAGQLLYVGCTMRPKKRWAEHNHDGVWAHLARSFRMAGPYNYKTARAIERNALATENPRFGCTPSVSKPKRRSTPGTVWVELIDRGILAICMERSDLTVRSLAEQCGSTRAAIGHLRSGMRKSCRLELAEKIESALDVPAGSLFGTRLTRVSRDSRVPA